VCFAAMTVGPPPPNATVATGVACADFGIRAKVRESASGGEYNTLSCVDEAGKVAHGRGNALTSGSCRSCSRSTIDATRN
jgi:hypothetical protein